MHSNKMGSVARPSVSDRWTEPPNELPPTPPVEVPDVPERMPSPTREIPDEPNEIPGPAPMEVPEPGEQAFLTREERIVELEIQTQPLTLDPAWRNLIERQAGGIAKRHPDTIRPHVALRH